MQPTIPAQMRAVFYREPGGPEVLQWIEQATPQPKPGEILIKVAAAGLNRADLMQRQGKYPPPPDASTILGMEASGIIVALGEGIKRWKIGDRVCALLAGGGYAEYVAVPEGQCLPVPNDMSLIEAASLPEAFVTVWANLFEAGGLKAGATALVHGGGSGIGTTAIQLAKLAGATIFVTVGSEEKAVACRKLGADLVINYRATDFVAAVKDATAGQGVDVVLDMIGGDYVMRNLNCLKPLGRHVSIATQQGKSAEIDLRLVMQKRLTLTGSTMRGRMAAEKAELIGLVERHLWPWAASQAFKPLISKVWPIKNVAEAHKMMESAAHIGKIVLDAAS